jgi:hypothetical protein
MGVEYEELSGMGYWIKELVDLFYRVRAKVGVT